MELPPNNVSRCKFPRSLKSFSFGAFLLLAAIGGYASTRNSLQSQTSTPPAATPSTQADTKKTSETPASSPATVTDPRQAQILADTQKLLKLSQELKAEVAKSNKDTLSLSVIKKAEEVEKLAKTLKEEMSKSQEMSKNH